MKIGIKKSIVTGGKEISIETGKLAKQADGSVVLQMGNTVLLATVVAFKPKEPVTPTVRDISPVVLVNGVVLLLFCGIWSPALLNT